MANTPVVEDPLNLPLYCSIYQNGVGGPRITTIPWISVFLQLGNIEYKMNAEGLRKVQPVSYRSYSSHNNKRAQLALAQLPP